MKFDAMNLNYNDESPSVAPLKVKYRIEYIQISTQEMSVVSQYNS